MTTEFANMYEGGSKEGEKRIKNEMYQLKQILAKKIDMTSIDGNLDSPIDVDDVPDMASEEVEDSPDTAETENVEPAAADEVDAADVDALLDSAADGDAAAESK